MSAVLPLGLMALGLIVVEAKAETANYEVYENEAAFYAELNPDTITVVDFDYYPDGNPVPTGYDPAGNWSGFEIMGDEWSSLGVTFSTPSGQPMSTVNITEFPQGTMWHNYSSPPNSLTPGQPPYVGYGVSHSPDTEDPIYISFDPPRWAVGLVFIDNAPSGDGEHVEFRATDGSIIADLPSPATGYLSFLGIVSDVPVAAVEVFEEKYDSDDVSYDNIVHGVPTGITPGPAPEPTLDEPGPPSGTIRGTVFGDCNRDGVRQPDERPLVGVTFSVRSPGGVLFGGWTGDDGTYGPTALSPSDYWIDLHVPPGYTPTTPTTRGPIAINGNVVTGQDFGLTGPDCAAPATPTPAMPLVTETAVVTPPTLLPVAGGSGASQGTLVILLGLMVLTVGLWCGRRGGV